MAEFCLFPQSQQSRSGRLFQALGTRTRPQARAASTLAQARPRFPRVPRPALPLKLTPAHGKRGSEAPSQQNAKFGFPGSAFPQRALLVKLLPLASPTPAAPAGLLAQWPRGRGMHQLIGPGSRPLGANQGTGGGPGPRIKGAGPRVALQSREWEKSGAREQHYGLLSSPNLALAACLYPPACSAPSGDPPPAASSRRKQPMKIMKTTRSQTPPGRPPTASASSPTL
ncbi:hypothetical protein H8957_000276 [Semnopithecus entellus]